MLVVADDEQLSVKQARAGSPDAWATLFRRYQLPLYVYVFELVRHEQTSLDIVQETFINAARHLAGLRDDAKFGSWLFRIAHQKCVQHWRKQNSAPDFTAELDEESLDTLAPRFIDKLPHDIITGGPMKYRRITDGKFGIAK